MLIAMCFVFGGCKAAGETAGVDQQRKTYTKEEIVSLFTDNRDSFNTVFEIIINDEDFFEKGRNLLDDGDACILSTKDPNLELFSDANQEEIVSFWEQYEPYMITYDTSQEYIKITFIGSGEHEGFTLQHWINQDDQTGLDEYLSRLRQWYVVEAMPDGWYLAYTR
jgi:hypothetical protein